jgi:hypothetical protein
MTSVCIVARCLRSQYGEASGIDGKRREQLKVVVVRREDADIVPRSSDVGLGGDHRVDAGRGRVHAGTDGCLA